MLALALTCQQLCKAQVCPVFKEHQSAFGFVSITVAPSLLKCFCKRPLLPCSSLLFPSSFPSGFSVHCCQMLFSMSLEWNSSFLVSIFSKPLSWSTGRMREKWPLLGAMTPETSLLQHFWCDYCKFVCSSSGIFVTNARNVPLHVEENPKAKLQNV